MKFILLFSLIIAGCSQNSSCINPYVTINLATSKYKSRKLGIGLVTPDLLQNFVQMPYYSEEEQLTRVCLATKAIKDAYAQGAGHITILAPGYFPQSPEDVGNGYNDLALWQLNSMEYWHRIDLMMNEINQYNMAVIIHGWEDLRIFATLGGETTRDLVTNPNSKSYALYSKYWIEFITRYKDFPNIEMYSVPNEMNLIADLDMVSRCVQNCESVGNFSTDEMNIFSYRIVTLFHSVTNKPIISEMGLQRPNAYHLRNQPEWSQNGPDWTADTQDEWLHNLLDISSAFDIVDSHAYNGSDGTALELFGMQNTELIDLMADTIKNTGKRYFISEFGDSDASTAPFRTITKEIMQTLVNDNTLGGSIWGYEYYQSNTYAFQVENGAVYDLIPGNYPQMFELMQYLNNSLHILNF